MTRPTCKQTRQPIYPLHPWFKLAFLAILLLCPLSVKGHNRPNYTHSTIDTIVGIDLGTSYSRVAVERGGKAEIIAKYQGYRVIPSWNAFIEHEQLLGLWASAAFYSGIPKINTKPLIGCSHDESSAQKDTQHGPSQVVCIDGTPMVEMEYKGAFMLDPDDISYMILSQLKETTERCLGHEVKQAAITVPPYFDDARRWAIKEAGTMTGFEAIRIVNQPIATAAAYGLDRAYCDDAQCHPARVVVYDLGGGTFDVSLLSIEDGVFEIIATAGNTVLGGEDFNNRIVDHLAAQYHAKTGIDVTRDKCAMQKLQSAAEEAKRTLSNEETAYLEIKAFEGENDYVETLTRAKFEELNQDLFRKTMLSVQQVLKGAKLGKEDINEVILVGGSTRIPKVQQLVKEFFGKEPLKGINPDEVNAYGAAVRSAMTTRDDGTIVRDTSGLTIGIELATGLMKPLIPRNSNMPIRKSHLFSTAEDDQRSVQIVVSHGERPFTHDNHELYRMELDGIQPAPQGVPQIEVTLEMDANGNLKISAVELGTGNSETEDIGHPMKRIPYEEIDRMAKDTEAFADEDREPWEWAEAFNTLRRGYIRFPTEL